MDKNIAMRWVKALRSKKYKQGRGFLCRVDGRGNCKYCCLGVLSELYQEDRTKNSKKPMPTSIIREGSSRSIRVKSYNTTHAVLPISVKRWSKMRSTLGFLIGSNLTTKTLADMNDGGDSFSKIATFIEKNYKNL